MTPLITKVLIVLGAAGLATLSATVLKDSEAGTYVFALAGTLLGLALPEFGKKLPAKEGDQ